MKRDRLHSAIPTIGMGVPIIGQTGDASLAESHPVAPYVPRDVVPQGDWVLCRPVREHVSKGGIIHENKEGLVLAVGPASKSGVRAGDRIVWSGRLIDFTSNGEHYTVCRDAVPGPGDLAINSNGEPVGPPFLLAILVPVPPEQPS